MNISIDLAYKSLFKHGEELCGDMVQMVSSEDFKLLILTDGMGSGVRANIFATMTSKILATLIGKGLPIDEAVETLARTLPRSSVNGVAYCTFSVLQVFYSGEAYIVEYDNPQCVCVRNHALLPLPFTELSVCGKVIRECRFRVQVGDAFLFMSDGAIYCSGDDIMNMAWDRNAVAQYTLRVENQTKSASRLACMVDDVCNDLYLGIPRDDTTIAVARIHEEKRVNILTGPPMNREKDEEIVNDFMQSEGVKIVSGGTTSELAARVLKQEIHTDFSTLDGDIPPMSKIAGIDCVTEGVVTLRHVIRLLEIYASGEFDSQFFEELDRNNGASRIATFLIDDCTKVCFFVGTAENMDAENLHLYFDLTEREGLVKRIIDILKKLDKDVNIYYY